MGIANRNSDEIAIGAKDNLNQGIYRPFLNRNLSMITPNNASFIASHIFVTNTINATVAAVIPISEKNVCTLMPTSA
jgi:hypothetical protein